MDRVSSSTVFLQAMAGLRRNQAEIARLQDAVSSGERIRRPSDDPAAASRALDLDSTLARIGQHRVNARLADQRLALEDSTLEGVQNLLIRVKELALAANSGTQSAHTRAAFGAEVAQRLEELLDLANVRDANGDYLFAGSRTDTRPFSMDGASVVYAGDQGARELEVSATRRVQAGDSGDQVFLRVPGGNGRFTVAADAGNAGTGVMAAGSVTDPGALTGDTYSVRFTAADSYEVVNDTQGVTVLAAQPFAEGAPIAFDGIQTAIRGTPQAGDRFEIAPAGASPVFDTLHAFAGAMAADPADPAARAQHEQALNGIIDSLDRALDHVLEVRAGVGARQSAVASIDERNADLELELAATRSQLRDVDMTDAVARLQQRIGALEAAQATFVAVSRLSLFDLLR